MIDIYMTFHQEFYDETGLCISRTKQLYYTVFDEKTAEAVIENVRHALVMAECTVMNVIKVFTPIMEVLER